MSAAGPVEPYADVAQQREAGVLGMYLFLASEIMLFGGIIGVLLIDRTMHPAEFVAASGKLHVWLGTANTAVLLTSSFCVAVAVTALRAERDQLARLAFGAALLLGLGFLGIKALEYSAEAQEGLLPGFENEAAFSGPAQHLFMNLYLIATALHALHVAIGLGLLGWCAVRPRQRGRRGRLAVTRSEFVGLYWHLVDVIWVFLFPLLYLQR